jgi:hypothetical protein
MDWDSKLEGEGSTGAEWSGSSAAEGSIAAELNSTES